MTPKPKSHPIALVSLTKDPLKKLKNYVFQSNIIVFKIY